MDDLIIAGLGNPGSKYRFTRHNIGFLVLEKFALEMNVSITTKIHDCLAAVVHVGGKKIHLVEPQTFMNCSGFPLQRYMQFYRIPVTNLLVVCDDLNIPFSTLRIRKNGGAGGHNGLKSIIEQLSTRDFARFRIGIGGGNLRNTAKFVLEKFSEKEFDQLAPRIDDAAECLNEFVHNGIDAAMNRFNGSPEMEEK
jgi:PTH1 family peptidyl-tRNA hydrolase